MKENEKLLDIIGEVDEELIPNISENVQITYNKPAHSKKVYRMIALFASVAAVIVLVIFITRPANEISVDSGKNQVSTGNDGTNTKDNVYENGFEDNGTVPLKEADTDTQFLLATATYPENTQNSAKYPLRGESDSIYNFFSKTAATILAEADKNVIYSPISLYIALAMSAEITGGNSQQQIAALLGQKELEKIRQNAKTVWEYSYADFGKLKIIPASSLWLNASKTYKKSTIESLAKNYYASVFGGDPASDEYVARLRKWINDHTDGLLKNFVSGIKMKPDMIVTLVSTLNFSDGWSDKFSETETKADVFHTPEGDIKCDFMHADKSAYDFGKKFSSVSFWMGNGCKMITVLPDEGVTCEELLQDSEALLCLMGKAQYTDIKRTHVSIPKFDISSSINLNDELKALGVTDIFDPLAADFSPLVEQDIAYVDKIQQDVRVMIDEEGCRAAAVTNVEACWGEIIPDGDFYYSLDRPFLFAIVQSTNVPLFMGIVNNPVRNN